MRELKFKIVLDSIAFIRSCPNKADLEETMADVEETETDIEEMVNYTEEMEIDIEEMVTDIEEIEIDTEEMVIGSKEMECKYTFKINNLAASSEVFWFYYNSFLKE